MWSFGTTMTMATDKESSKQSHVESQPPQQPAQEPSQQPPQSLQSPQSAQNMQASREPMPPILSPRSLKQLGFFFAGAGFLSLSIVITRRAVARRILATIPKFFEQSNHPPSDIQTEGSLIAFDALRLATLNVIGFGIMGTGGIAWAFNISGVDDLRRMTHRSMGLAEGHTDEDAERAVEEWVAKILGHKEQVVKAPSKKDD
ncbi:hypothetical protein F5B20DRAFT_262538 [Whalleya microplaca]|nr:hypothetical protein F5B20DRAFT_262538 [Whalleya microplaca]